MNELDKLIADKRRILAEYDDYLIRELYSHNIVNPSKFNLNIIDSELARRMVNNLTISQLVDIYNGKDTSPELMYEYCNPPKKHVNHHVIVRLKSLAGCPDDKPNTLEERFVRIVLGMTLNECG